MVKMGPHAASRLAAYLRARLTEMAASGRTQTDVAAMAGFKNQNMISMLKNGATKLPLDRVAGLARALETDLRYLFVLALQQEGNATTAQEIAEIFGAIVTVREVEWVEALREASNHSDPPLTKRARGAIRAIFGA